MYIYLSDRKRRSYLSYSLPQNLSGKSLSFKDHRFLQKKVYGQSFKTSKQILSFKLLRQQKFLYEKHILKSFNSKIFQSENSLYCDKYFIYTYKSLSTNFFSEICKKKRGGDISTDLTFGQNLKKNGKLKFSKNIEEKKVYAQLSPAQFQQSQNFSFFPPLSSLSIYIQPFKIYKKKNLLFLENYSETYNPFPQNILKKDKWKDSSIQILPYSTSNKVDKPLAKKENGVELPFSKPPVVKHKVLENFLFKYPLFVNGKNQYIYSNFLYQGEQVKTCIIPQSVRDSSPSRANSILHEKKKIKLFYGQIAQRDINIYCQSASSLPGLFEDNMYTLLESRVDVLVFRAGFSNTIAGARQLIRNGLLQLNGKKLYSCKIFAKPGDFFSVSCYPQNFYKSTTVSFSTFYKKSLNFSPNLFSPYTQNFNSKFYQKSRRIYKNSSIKFPFLPNLTVPIPNSLYFYNTRICQSINGSLSLGYFLYNNIVSKLYSANKFLFCFNKFYTIQNSIKSSVLSKSFSRFYQSQFYHKSFLYNILKKNCYINAYCLFLLKKNTISRNSLWIKTKFDVLKYSMKNIQNSNCASIWGQKPLHLEISHKTTSFVYLYKPQKIISSLCIDFNCFRFSK